MQDVERMDQLGYLMEFTCTKDDWKFASTDSGVLCAMMVSLHMTSLILMLEEWCVDNWESQKIVSSTCTLTTNHSCIGGSKGVNVQ